jgi:hypothetical protein
MGRRPDSRHLMLKKSPDPPWAKAAFLIFMEK